MKTELTIAQYFILNYAHEKTEGKLVEFPDNIKGGARKKVIECMFNRALITPLGDDWFIAAEGYDALGVPRKGPMTPAGLDAVISAAEEQSNEPVQKPTRTRDSSKQAQVIAMLKRPEGATIAQIMDVTGWLQHTVRGTFAGAFKKKLGLTITSEKPEGGDRVYYLRCLAMEGVTSQ
ncbi:DUF3489 domain-containing protein [Ferrovum sp.]|uniref:DUF3489 domain-containing protein n=1 Tax=Ferrovum sp. TaxID=2609467 RepID=UPI0026062F33|nr:DUF3489 domain-containing protein [Ferrovum sp.]